MGTIICQTCQQTIEHYENEKVVVLYGTCPDCETKKMQK
ncbi:GapA-binding peptide SR1P [Ornithinibacillus bavariensis]|nr:GapA-binding peptide SR1P [Ornithinibacillus sp.]